MAYLPPGGGRMNVTIGGNTAGVGAAISTGTLALAGGNNIQLSQNGANGITIHGAGVALANTQTTYNTGTAQLSVGGGAMTIASAAGQKYNFSVPNSSSLSVTGALSMSVNASTISLGVPAQTNQDLSLYALGNTTQNSSTVLNASVLSFNGLGAARVGYSNGSIQISASTQTAQTQNLHNLTLAGNSTSAGAGYVQVSSGTLTLAGGNNVTLSQNGNAVTISGPNVPSAASNTFGMSNIGNTSGTTGVISGSALQFVFAGGNNVTLSQSINASSGTITISAANQTAQTQNLHNLTLAGNSTSAGAGYVQVSSGTLTLAGGNNVTLSQNGNAVTVSAANQTAQTQNLHNLTLAGNSTSAGAGYAQISSGTLTLAGGNNITLSQNGNAISIVGGAGGGGAALSAGTQSVNTGTVNFANSNGITFGMSGSNQITASHNGITLQSNQTQGYTAGTTNGGNTTLTSTGTFDARSVYLNAHGALSAGFSSSSMVVSAPNVSSLVQSGAVSISTAGNTLTISGIPFTGGVSNLGNTSGSTGTVSNQLVFVGTNGIGLSQSTAAGGATISINGGPYLSRWEYPEGLFNPLNTQGQGSLSINHMYVPFNVTGSAMKIGGSLSAATNTSATTASVNVSLWMGIYTLTGSTLSLVSSGSANNGFQWSQSASSTANTSINSMRQMTVPMNINMTPGQYWVGAVMSSATTYTSFAYTLYGNSLIPSAATGAVLTPIGSNTSANRDAMLFQGIYTANTSAGPLTMGNTDINNTSISNVMRANFYNVIYNATY